MILSSSRGAAITAWLQRQLSKEMGGKLQSEGQCLTANLASSVSEMAWPAAAMLCSLMYLQHRISSTGNKPGKLTQTRGMQALAAAQAIAARLSAAAQPAASLQPPSMQHSAPAANPYSAQAVAGSDAAQSSIAAAQAIAARLAAQEPGGSSLAGTTSRLGFNEWV